MRIAIETFGCSANAADGDTLAALLEQAGHVVLVENGEGGAKEKDLKDLVILNTCTVKDASFRSFERRLAELESAGMRVVVAGCIPSAHPGLKLWRGRVILGVDNLADIAKAVERAAAGEEAQFLGAAPRADRLELPSRPQCGVIEIVPISQGCLSQCSFCETRFARGRLVSYPIDSIARRIEAALNRGAREIWLTSQDTAAYGHDAGLRLRDLLARLRRLYADYRAREGENADFRIRLGMANPLYLRDQWEDVAESLAGPPFFRFLHFPLQSGSDAVLDLMNRGYRAAEWIELCQRFLARVPDLTLATDIIVGFPGETEEDFRATLAALEAIRPPVVNRSKFCPRPNTMSARMTKLRVHGAVIHERSARLDKVVRRIVDESLDAGLGRVEHCLVDQCRRAGSVLARTESYRPVAIPMSETEDSTHGQPGAAGESARPATQGLLGGFHYVEIRARAQWHWIGEIQPAPLSRSCGSLPHRSPSQTPRAPAEQ